MSTATTTATQAVIGVRDLTVRFRRFTALDGVSLEVPRGATVGLVGESGSGKSTLAKAILGLVPVHAGRIELDGRDITNIRGAERRSLGRTIQAVFQDPNTSLNPSFTIERSLLEPLHAQGMAQGDVKARVAEVLEAVGIDPSAAARLPRHFSGGQRQRISIARALITDPEVVICDEAVSALDLSVQAQVLNLLANIQAQRGISYLFISHDMSVVRHICHQVTVLYRGHVVETGTATQVTQTPTHPYTRKLLNAAPVADPLVQRGRRREGAKETHS